MHKIIKKIYLEYMYFRSNLLCLQIIWNTDYVNYQNFKKHFSILEDWLIMHFSKIDVWKFNNFSKICHKNQKYSQFHSKTKSQLGKTLFNQKFTCTIFFVFALRTVVYLVTQISNINTRAIATCEFKFIITT